MNTFYDLFENRPSMVKYKDMLSHFINKAIDEMNIKTLNDVKVALKELDDIKNSDNPTHAYLVLFGLDDNTINTTVDIMKEKLNEKYFDTNANKRPINVEIKEVHPQHVYDNPPVNTGIDVKTNIKTTQDEKESEITAITPNSVNLNQNVALQIHHLVAEYVDTFIRPNSKNVPEDMINAIYGTLYDFASWMYKK